MLHSRFDRLEDRMTNMEMRQTEIYQVARAIEHSNNTGKAELDEHQVKLSKHEGTFKKIASNL